MQQICVEKEPEETITASGSLYRCHFPVEVGAATASSDSAQGFLLPEWRRGLSRESVIARAAEHFDSGAFRAELARRVAIPTVSRLAHHAPDLRRYLEAELEPAFRQMGFETAIYSHELAPGPFLLATRMEDSNASTLLHYGHGDVVAGLDEQWTDGSSPWDLTERDDRWYGRGTADNKGQHTINMAAMRAVLERAASWVSTANFS